jgi:hypothetical protein
MATIGRAAASLQNSSRSTSARVCVSKRRRIPSAKSPGLATGAPELDRERVHMELVTQPFSDNRYRRIDVTFAK